VIVRDPERNQKDDYFFCTDPHASPACMVEDASARWGIEEAVRELKQSLGLDHVQSWSPRAVLRQAPLALVLHTLTQVAYAPRAGLFPGPEAKPQPQVDLPSFHGMLSALRFAQWQERIIDAFGPNPKLYRILRPLESALSANA